MNQKIILGLITVLFALPSFASSAAAEMPSSGEAELLAKIAELLSQVSVLQKELTAVKAADERGRVSLVFRLVGILEKGTQGDDVKTLQTLLAKDIEVYPEGFVTGYYGTLTRTAVARFQNKHPKSELRVESLTAPRISDISATTTRTTMTVAWKTNVPTSAKIWWGSPGPLDAERMTPIRSSALSENHSAVFSGGIFASTTYAFIIAVSDKDGNTSTTTEQFYVTP
jgi:peptidoglycan hydrolase-like protein with peptidoglycan-binding domain